MLANFNNFTILVFITAFISTFGLIKVYSEIAYKLNFLDTPNERSSHNLPTPRGAGIVFLLLFLINIGILFKLEGLSFKGFYVLCIGSLVYTILGFLDDIKILSVWERLLPQFLVASWVLLELTSYLEIPFIVKFLPWDWQPLAFIFGVLFIIWMVNLFNFMDGLDGFLGGQVFVIGIGSFMLNYLQGQLSLAIMYLFVPTVIAPFLYFNWRPAKIFMGDSGAYFLGFFFAVLGLIGKIEYDTSLVAQVILMGSLICDATLTLFVRFFTSGKIFQGHKTHGFQILRHKYGWRTSRVVFLYMLVTLVWFLPWSVYAIYMTQYAVGICAVSYIFICLALLKLNVGKAF